MELVKDLDKHLAIAKNRSSECTNSFQERPKIKLNQIKCIPNSIKYGIKTNTITKLLGKLDIDGVYFECI